MASSHANWVQYNEWFKKSLMRVALEQAYRNRHWGASSVPGWLFMSGNGARRLYDKAERDRQHALRRIQRRRTGTIAAWLIVPVFLIVAVIGLVATLIWRVT